MIIEIIIEIKNIIIGENQWYTLPIREGISSRINPMTNPMNGWQIYTYNEYFSPHSDIILGFLIGVNWVIIISANATRGVKTNISPVLVMPDLLSRKPLNSTLLQRQITEPNCFYYQKTIYFSLVFPDKHSQSNCWKSNRQICREISKKGKC